MADLDNPYLAEWYGYAVPKPHPDRPSANGYDPHARFDPAWRSTVNDSLAEYLSRRAALDPSLSPEGAPQRSNPNGFWGPKTASDDMPWYLPESLVGDLGYRYQGVATHGAMAALPFGNAVSLGRLLNALYAGGTMALGRTDPTKRVSDQLPDRSYRPELPKF